jgi:hypothetical protein
MRADGRQEGRWWEAGGASQRTGTSRKATADARAKAVDAVANPYSCVLNTHQRESWFHFVLHDSGRWALSIDSNLRGQSLAQQIAKKTACIYFGKVNLGGPSRRTIQSECWGWLIDMMQRHPILLRPDGTAVDRAFAVNDLGFKVQLIA